MPYPPVDEMAAAVRRAKEPETVADTYPPEVYSADERAFLLRVAREAIAASLEHREYHPEPLTPRLAEPRACFTTLHIEGQLRGCVGQVMATEPLVRAVAETAVSAAFGDPRFLPLASDELPKTHIEISVLSPMAPIRPEEIRAGLHGLLVSCAGRRGLLLPQVATDFGWNADEFLCQTCRKAGLPPNAWQLPGTEIYGFTAVKFGE